MGQILNNIRKLLATQTQGVLIAMASILSLVMALSAEKLWGILPCDLCLYERCFFAATAIFGAFYGLRNYFFYKIMFVCSLLGGAAITFYHVGVEHQWWLGPTACSGNQTEVTSIEELRQLLKSKNVVRCDVPGWIILNLSAVVWAFLFFITSFLSFCTGWWMERRLPPHLSSSC